MKREDIRNIAIIAHVDHGKTTLVDEMLKQGGAFRENQAVVDRVMDSGDLERERGITILAKNTSATYNGVKINIVDTPGHADFGGEVERVLKMVDGVLLLVDAFEGPMPQTRFVLEHALQLSLPVIVVVNKVDRPDSRSGEISNEVFDLLIDLNADDSELDSPVLYCSGRKGTASLSPDSEGHDLRPLFDTILEHIPAPDVQPDMPLRLLVSSLDYNEYVGRIAIGKIEQGSIHPNMEVCVCDYHDPDVSRKAKVTALYTFEGLSRVPATEIHAGDIVALSGIDDINIGNTICDPEHPHPLAFVKISEPTVEMTFSVNDGPFAGTEGKFVTTRHLRERLYRETLKDVSLRVQDLDTKDSFRVMGRGEMHLSILIETMRREGYEMLISPPRVLTKEINGVVCEPIEEVSVDVPEGSVGSVIEKLGSRKGELKNMEPSGNRMKLTFNVPSRGLFGYRSEFLTDTNGEGIMNTLLFGYEPMKGDIPRRSAGSLVAHETGDAVTYGLFNAQERGTLFIGAGVKVYEGMVVGCSPKPGDLVVNVCKKKHVTNMRASGSDEALRLTPPRTLTLEETLEFISDDELVEVTPQTIRIRKAILNAQLRMKANKN